MTTTKPACDPNGRYNQTQAAQLLGVERHTIKRWEENGYLKFKIRRVGKTKFTTGQQIIKCWEATYL